MREVLGCGGSRTLRSHVGLKHISTTLSPTSITVLSTGTGTYLAQSTINCKVSAIDKAALIARQEHDRMSLFNGLAESTTGEVHFTTESLGLVIAQPVLQQGSATTISRPDGTAIKGQLT